MLVLESHHLFLKTNIVLFADAPFDKITGDYTEFYHCISDQSSLPFIQSQSFTSIIDLTHSESILWENIQRKTRQKIRKAENIGVKIIYNQHYDEFCQLYLRFQKRKGIRSSYVTVRPFDEIKKHGLLVLEEFDGTLIGGALCLYDDSNIVCWQMCSQRLDMSDDKMKNIIGCSTCYGIWQAMKIAKKMGKKQWDFGGLFSPEQIKNDPSNEGINLFKLRLGGSQEIRYNYEKYNTKYRISKSLYNLLIS